MMRRSLLVALLAWAGSTGCSNDPMLGLVGIVGRETIFGVPFAVTIPILNPNGGAVTWSLPQAPAGMTLTDGDIAWTPGFADLGTYVVRVQADTPTETAETSFTLRVHQGLDMGTTFSPSGHTMTANLGDFIDHYTNSPPYGRIISVHTNWRDIGDIYGEVPQAAISLGQAGNQYGFVPAFGFGWTDGDGNPDLLSATEPVNNTWSNVETRNEFRNMVTQFAQQYQPRYLFLGNEVNTYWLTASSTEWDDWLSQYDECYDAIKAVSPDTIVFTTLQLEHLKGLGASTTGWMDAAHWEIVDDLEASGRLDALGFSSYPYFEYDEPADIPADYYDEITMHWSGSTIFTEIAWPAMASAPFPGSETDQADFPDEFFSRTEMLDLGYVAWLFLHDLDSQAMFPGFEYVGLRDNLGTVVRSADPAWRVEVALRQRPASDL